MFSSVRAVLKARREQILVCAFPLLLWALLLPHTFSHDLWTYSWDSAPYVETAIRLHDGEGFSHRVIHGIGRDIWEPLTLWPPGYSLMIAVVMCFGVSAPLAGLIVSVVAAGVSLVLLSLICLRFMNWMVAAPLVGVIAVSPGFQMISAQCLSDSAFYMWVLASVYCIVAWSRNETGWRWLLAAGVFAGAAWLTRNAALSLLAATMGFFIIHLAWRKWRDVARAAVTWGAGFAICAVPLIVRNLVAFGELNPYDMPPSDISFGENLKQAINVVARDLTTFEFAGAVAARLAIPLIILTVCAVAFLLWRWKRKGGHLLQLLQHRRVELFFLGYAGLYAAIIVVGRTRYRWGEVISTRYMVQIDWPLLLLLAVLAGVVLQLFRMNAMRQNLMIAAGFVLLLALNFREQLPRLTTPAPAAASSPLGGTVTPEACAYLEREVGEDQILIAQRADILRIHCGMNARAIPPTAERSDSLRRPLDPVAYDAALKSGLLWGIVVNDRDAALRGDFGPILRNAFEDPAPDFQLVVEGDGVFILRYVGNS
jgi:hypothetical protein